MGRHRGGAAEKEGSTRGKKGRRTTTTTSRESGGGRRCTACCESGACSKGGGSNKGDSYRAGCAKFFAPRNGGRGGVCSASGGGRSTRNHVRSVGDGSYYEVSQVVSK